MTDGVKPITAEERQSRIEKARRLMHENHLGAIVVEPGSTMFYYTGRRTPNSTLVIPAAGEVAWFVPENTADTPAGDVRHGGDSTKAVTQILADRKAAGRIGIEERVRFATYDALHRESPAREFVSADPVTIGCRVIKSPAEIALLQRANDVTVAAYRAAFSTLHEGMDQRELSAYIDAAYQALGFRGGAMVIYGKYTAFPHGSVQPQTLHDGDFVLVDDGCSVEGYQSDITRTVIFGKPTDRQRRVWDLERKAQDAALAAAKPGATCESVDAAARKVITDAGFGPGYKVPGLPHRTGHGIGLDGHEWTYLVKGNKTRMEPGMCFSNEPTIAIYGEFGVRLEDCMYITPDGARMFTAQSPAIDRPFA
ncbi:MAG TPA: Xaa-Pro peptidase family protein [Candidatus Limnocylindrales bacterium]|nr:Xaa-Pro peptidase family protein [Candidatus Limnocylindrales bacterium]